MSEPMSEARSLAMSRPIRRIRQQMLKLSRRVSRVRQQLATLVRRFSELVQPLSDLVQRHRPQLVQRAVPVVAVFLLFLAMGGTWRIASAAPPSMVATFKAEENGERPVKKSAKELTGKLNLNTATEDQLMMLPTVGPAKAERIVAWRKKNGGFKRIADLRRVKGFGYKTFKRLEPFLDIKGETTLR